MQENFCKMTAVLSANKIKSFVISDPYSLCSHFPAWKTSKAFLDDAGEVTGFIGPNGVKYAIYFED
jgi:hypothetical protein